MSLEKRVKHIIGDIEVYFQNFVECYKDRLSKTFCAIIKEEHKRILHEIANTKDMTVEENKELLAFVESILKGNKQ